MDARYGVWYFARTDPFTCHSILLGLFCFIIGLSFIAGFILHRDRKRNKVQPRFQKRNASIHNDRSVFRARFCFFRKICKYPINFILKHRFHLFFFIDCKRTNEQLIGMSCFNKQSIYSAMIRMKRQSV